MKVRPHIVRLRWRSIVHVATDIAVPLLVPQLTDRHTPRVFRNLQSLAVGVADLFDVLLPEPVLRFALSKFPVGIDEEHILAFSRSLLVNHKDSGRDAGAVENLRRQSDDRIELPRSDKFLPTVTLLSATEENAMRHDDGELPACFE